MTTSNTDFQELQERVQAIHDQIVTRHLLADGFHMTEPTPEEEKVFEEATDFIITTQRWNDLDALFADCSLYGSCWIQKAFMKCREFIPKDELYRITTAVYRRNGYDFPVWAITELMDIRPHDYLSELPYEFWDTDPITIYRASLTKPKHMDTVSSELSWTLDPMSAKKTWEYRTYQQHEYCYVYEAQIFKKDIIAYMPEMNEHEILQHGAVFDIREIGPVVLGGMCKQQDEDRERLGMQSLSQIDFPKEFTPEQCINRLTNFYPLQHDNLWKFKSFRT